MTTRIMPYQDGRDLVFCLVRDGEEVRWPDSFVMYPGLGLIRITQPRITFPTIEAATEYMERVHP